MKGIRILRRLFLFTAFSLSLPPALPAQPADTYMVPQTIFVGDMGRLIITLGRAYQQAEPFILDPPGREYSGPDLEIRRIELEKKNGETRLLIDFVPYSVGILALPAIPLGEREMTGLSIEVASILSPGEAALSDSAAPLIAPGTSFLVYGGSGLILALLLCAAFLAVWGRRHIPVFFARWRRRRLLRSMARFLSRLREKSRDCDQRGRMEMFSLLSGEFREFLSMFTGVNCRILTPPEFDSLSAFEPGYLSGLFRRWETARFSGAAVGARELQAALDEASAFIARLEKAERAPVPAVKAAAS